jgi:hypothetical protein
MKRSMFLKTLRRRKQPQQLASSRERKPGFVGKGV